MAEFVLINRRLFLRRLGKGTVAVAVLGSCENNVTSATSIAEEPPVTSTTSRATTTAAGTSATPPLEPARFHRVNLGFVSAYLIARGQEAAVVDTGVAGSAGAIGEGLGEIGLDWSAVGHVILTHHHPDHVGSLNEVLGLAQAAAAYAGAEDIPQISSPRELSTVAEGDEIFGLTVIATPGHTPGHISVLDPTASVLIVGDAMNGFDGISGPNPKFSSDMPTGIQTVRKLAGLTFETAYFGHGEPVMARASELTAELAASL